MMYRFFLKSGIYLFAFLLAMGKMYAQPVRYSVANGHAHNDYEHNVPFVQAFQLGFGSIEADVILENDSLYVGHQQSDILTKPLFFERDYIVPLYRELQQSQDASRSVILLIDLKTEALATLTKVISIIEKYPLLTKASGVQFVITGNQPPPSAFDQYPGYIYFDGNIGNPEHLRHLNRIALFSDNFRNYSKWKGKGNIRSREKRVLDNVIGKVHALGKRIRFWGCPDNPYVWSVFMKMGVDYINTDHIGQLADFFKSHQVSSAESADGAVALTVTNASFNASK